MPRRKTPPDLDPFALAQAAVSAGRHADAAALLLAELDRRAAEPLCAAAAGLIRALQAARFDPEADGMAAALDRLLAVVERQDGQLRELQALLKARL